MTTIKRRTRLALLLAGCGLLFGACRESAPPEAEFWRWFSEHAGRLSWARSVAGNAAASEIADRLAALHPELVYELEGEPGADRVLILSAQGSPEVARVVSTLAAAAPEIDGWRIQAFRPRLPLDSIISYRGFALDPRDVWFSYVPEPNGDAAAKLDLYLPGIGGPTHELAREAGLLMLHAAIGERTATERVAKLEFHVAPDDPVNARLMPLEVLPQLLPEQ